MLALVLAGCGGARSGVDGGVDPVHDEAVEELPDEVVDAVEEEPPAPWSVTFFVVGDPHCDPEPADDQLFMAAAIGRVAAEGEWPAHIHGVETGLEAGPIGEPAGVVFVGDVTGSGDMTPWASELETFRRFYEAGAADEAIAFASYVGFGNHDLDRDGFEAETFRAAMWRYVEGRHAGTDAPVPVSSFHEGSRSYSWDWEGLHLVQTHTFAGDTKWDRPSGLEWLADDLASHAGPVIVFQHYGLDAFGLEERWWTDDDRTAWLGALEGHDVVAVIAGHSHYAMNYPWGGLDVYQVNNVKGEFGEGNRDGYGSFGIFRVTDEGLQMVTCRALDDTGAFELVAPVAVAAFAG